MARLGMVLGGALGKRFPACMAINTCLTVPCSPTQRIHRCAASGRSVRQKCDLPCAQGHPHPTQLCRDVCGLASRCLCWLTCLPPHTPTHTNTHHNHHPSHPCCPPRDPQVSPNDAAPASSAVAKSSVCPASGSGNRMGRDAYSSPAANTEARRCDSGCSSSCRQGEGPTLSPLLAGWCASSACLWHGGLPALGMAACLAACIWHGLVAAIGGRGACGGVLRVGCHHSVQRRPCLACCP